MEKDSQRYESLDLLFPPFRRKIDQLVIEAGKSGIVVFPFETYRSPLRQAEVLVAGKSNSMPGKSWHQYGLACDLVAGGPGRWTWTGIDWKKLGDIADFLNIEWGGDWSFHDMCHFQHMTDASIDTILSDCQKAGILYVWSNLLEE